MQTAEGQKIFLVFNTSYFGDVLLCDPLCRNIKDICPDSKTVFIVNKPFYEAAKYLKGVDEVVIYDKNGEHKGFFGMLKFIKDFKYKNPNCSIVTYRNLRNYFISLWIGTKHILQGIKTEEQIPNWQKHINLLKKYTDKELKNFPMIYEADKSVAEKFLNPQEKYIALCTTTKNKIKDIPFDVAVKLIEKINNNGYKAVFTGTGRAAEDYAKNLQAAGCEFTDLSNKTSIYELGAVLKFCKVLISADTGTMHMGCAVGAKVITVFYEAEKLAAWAPSKDMYDCSVIFENQTADNIWNETMRLING